MHTPAGPTVQINYCGGRQYRPMDHTMALDVHPHPPGVRILKNNTSPQIDPKFYCYIIVLESYAINIHK